jgi:hypothetical protein
MRTGFDVRRRSRRSVGSTTLSASLLAVLCLASLSPGDTRASPVLPPSGRSVMTVFRLHVAGDLGRQASFWVAYGPLADHWGLIRLHAVGRGNYTATRHLPAEGRTLFAYLAGQDTVRTRGGVAPGSPIVTIRLIGPVSASQLGTTTVHWQVPIG